VANFTSQFKPLAHSTLNWDTQLNTDLGNLETLLNGAVSVGSGQDMNGYTALGSFTGYNWSNAPLGLSDTFLAHVIADAASGAAVQTAHRMTNGSFESWRRYYVSGVGWTGWMIDTYDTGWVTSSTGITAASGWSLSASKYRILGGAVSISVVAARTGATITANTYGAIPTTPVANLPAGLVPAQSNGNISSVGASSTQLANGYASATGSCLAITTLAPSGALFTSSGSTVDLMGTYFL
jgi:hypothetical protein